MMKEKIIIATPSAASRAPGLLTKSVVVAAKLDSAKTKNGSSATQAASRLEVSFENSRENLSIESGWV
jgi:hypothetical protein